MPTQTLKNATSARAVRPRPRRVYLRPQSDTDAMALLRQALSDWLEDLEADGHGITMAPTVTTCRDPKTSETPAAGTGRGL